MRPIFLTEAEQAELLEELKSKIAKTRMLDGNFELKYKYTYNKEEHPRAALWYTPEAWSKMTGLVDMFDIEVGWYGVVERIADTEWIVTDILVFPQTVNSVHVDSDEKEFGKWWLDATEKYVKDGAVITMNGHSHVNMSVSPSATDLGDQQTKMADMKRGFYIFTIQNKKRESKNWIYDFDNNIVYEPDDIDVDVIIDTEDTLIDFLADAKNLVQKQVYTIASAAPKKEQKTAKKEDKESKESRFYGDYYPYIQGGHSGYGYYFEDY